MNDQATTPEANEQQKKKSGVKKFIIVLILTLLLGGGAATGTYFVWRNAGYLTTDNARVTTTLIAVTSNAQGTLERFTIYEGRRVEENEVLGWVENSEAFHSPFDGLVVQTNAVQEQIVSHMEPLAVIADLNDIHIQANIEETDVGRIQVGQPVTVTIDPFGNREFNGYISEISRITSAELTGQALFFNTGGTFTRVTHLIPIKISITDDVDLETFLGVNARVRIDMRTPFTPISPPPAPPMGIVARGVVESTERRGVYTNLGQTIEVVNVEVGDRVTEGQVLAILDTMDIKLAIAQQQAIIESARQSGQIAVADSLRMINEASANLAQNTNVHVVSAQATLSSAQSALDMARQSYEEALRDYREGSNPQIQNAQSFLRTARVELEAREREHDNIRVLANGGIASQEELRMAQTAVVHARNQYNDARTSYNTAVEFQQRQIDQLRIGLQAATTAHQSAQGVQRAAQTAAQQEIARLRTHTQATEVSANLEHLELALEQLERLLEDSTITAPISGTITEVIAREGAIGLGPLFVIEDTNNLRIITSFREYDLANITTGTELTITSPATGDAVYYGVITRINPAAIPHSPVAEFEAEVAVVSVDTDLRIGMNTRLNIVLEY